MHTCYGWRSDSCILIVATRLDVVSLYILVLILEKMLFKVTKKSYLKYIKMLFKSNSLLDDFLLISEGFLVNVLIAEGVEPLPGAAGDKGMAPPVPLGTAGW